MTMLRKLTKSEGIKPVPADIYLATVTDLKTDSGSFGTYLRFDFSISDGVYQGEKRSIIASDKFLMTTKGSTKLVEIIEALTGVPVRMDEEVDLDSMKGKKCRILLGEVKEKDGFLIQNVQKVLPSKE